MVPHSHGEAERHSCTEDTGHHLDAEQEPDTNAHTLCDSLTQVYRRKKLPQDTGMGRWTGAVTGRGRGGTGLSPSSAVSSGQSFVGKDQAAHLRFPYFLLRKVHFEANRGVAARGGGGGQNGWRGPKVQTPIVRQVRTGDGTQCGD